MSVFHLKYRPEKIADLDVKDVAEGLAKIFKSEEIPQAYLFAGPKGSGKTSAARILARLVNCDERKSGEPCGKCASCKDVLSGNSLDVVKIDAASNRGIDDIRLLKERAYLMPSRLKYKVFIIDEVHMLTKEAFNALLKLIEEPPKHTIFILCTTDAEKIPDTILSRLIRIDFRKGNKEEMLRSLMKVIEGEKIEIDKGAVDLIVARSDGSFRNLQRTFNEIYLQLGKKITIEAIEKYLSAKQGDYKEEDFESDLVSGKVKLILERFESMANNGANFVAYRERLMRYFQKKLLVNYGVGVVTDKGKLKETDLERWLELLVKVATKEKDVSIDQLPLELAVVEFLGNKPMVVGDEVVEKIVEEIEEIKIEEEIVISSSNNVSGVVSVEEIEKEWSKVLTMVKPFNHSVEAFLRATRPKSVNGQVLVIEVFYPFHKDKLEEPKNRKVVEMGLSKAFGVDLAFECVLGKSKKAPLVIKNDTPVEKVSENLPGEDKKDLYAMAKEIFG